LGRNDKTLRPENDDKTGLLLRRQFLGYGLKITGIFLGGSLLSLTSVRRVHSALEGIGVIGSYPFSPHYAMLVRQQRCNGCNKCTEACASANDVPAYGYRNLILKKDVPAGGAAAGSEFLPTLCNQCNRPPCVKVCPTRASYKNKKNGIVMIDGKLCIGCKACMASCPYSARYFKKESQSVDKCDFCFQTRLAQGNPQPACVEACPTGVYVFGDLHDEKSEVSKQIHAQEGTIWVLRPEIGTMPNVFYQKD
jgi:Fe-S-cluster-containing dehydrogenase component